MKVSKDSITSFTKFVSHAHDVCEIAYRCLQLGQKLKADVYIAHMADTLAGASALANKFGGKAIVDQVEIPEAYYRNERCYKEHKDYYDVYSEFFSKSILELTDTAMTVSNPLADHLKENYPTIRNVACIENFPSLSPFTPSNTIREQFGIAPHDIVVYSPNNVYRSFKFENVIRAFTQLDNKFHLVSIGYVPDLLQEELTNLIESLDLSKRVHFYGKAPYENLHSLASSADFAFIYRDDSVLNNRVALPNRFFDSIQSRLPLLCYDGPHMRELIEQYNIGKAFSYEETSDIAQLLKDFSKESDKYKTNIEHAAQQLVWEEQEIKFLEFLNYPTSVTFIGLRDLTKNNRTLRMIKTLLKHGTTVQVLTVAPPPESVYKHAVSWHHL